MTTGDNLHLIICLQPTELPGSLENYLNTLKSDQEHSPTQVSDLAAVVPVWGPALPTAFPSSALAASVSNHCCWQDSDGLNTEVGAKWKWLKTSPAAAWLRLTPTSFRNGQFMQDADAGGVRAAKADGVPVFSAGLHHAVTGRCRQAKIAAGIRQNKLPAADYPPSVPLLCPFQSFNLHPLSAFPTPGLDLSHRWLQLMAVQFLYTFIQDIFI